MCARIVTGSLWKGAGLSCDGESKAEVETQVTEMPVVCHVCPRRLQPKEQVLWL